MKKYRYFAGLLNAQAKWLNKMSERGYRLIGNGLLSYEFTECMPKRYIYTIEYVGNKSYKDSLAYKQFLEDCGYKVYYKNLLLDFSFRKLEIRPWADRGGVISTDSTTHNKELMIVEKENDGKPFELHTTIKDRIDYQRTIVKPWVYVIALCLILGCMLRSIPFFVAAALVLLPIIVAGVKNGKLIKENKLTDEEIGKPKVNVIYIITFVVIEALSIIFSSKVGNQGFSSYRALGFIGNTGIHKSVGKYNSLTGHLKKSIVINDGEINMDIVTESGSINILLRDKDGNVLYDEKDVQTTQVSIPYEGRLKIELEAQKHSGSFSFR